MATTLDFYLDKSGGLVAGGSCPFGSLPSLTNNDNYLIRLRVLERNASGAYADATLSSPSFKIGIGNVGDVPTSGEFKLAINAATSSAISYNATTTQVFNAISGIAGSVLVEPYGTTSSGWLVTAATANTALSFGGVNYTLFPTSSVLINTRRNYATDIKAQQVIQLSRNPAVFSDSFTATSGDGLALNNTQSGSATQNQTYELTVGNDVLGGSFALGFNGYSVAAPIGTSAPSLGVLLGTVTGIGISNISVQDNSLRGYIITFVNALGLQNVTSALTLDSKGVIQPNFYQTTLTMGTVQLDEIFVEENSNNISPTIEIEITEAGKIKTLYQGSANISKDLITSGSVVPAPTSQYYTKAETDATFVVNQNTNVDSTNRILYGASGQKSVDYGSRVLNDTANASQLQWGTSGVTIPNTLFASSNISLPSVAGTKIGTTTSQKIAFYGNTPVVQPTDSNAISCMAQLGLFKDATTTYGVFPLSPRTLTTTASIWFGGSINGNDHHSVSTSITGAATNDIVLLGLPSGFSEGLSLRGAVVTGNVVSITALNATNGAINPATATFRITVIGY